MRSAIYNELVYGGHLLALGTASIASAVAIIAGFSPTILLALMAYLFTYGAYTMNRATEKDQDEISHPERTAYLNKRRRLLPWISIFCFALGYALAFERNLYFFLALLTPLVLSILYSVGARRIQDLIGARRLKERLLIKNLVISFGWSLIPLLVGLYYLQVNGILLLFIPFVFLRLMENSIFFDVRDVVADSAFGTRTIPAVLGMRRTSNLLNVIDLISLAYVVLAVAANLVPTAALPLAAFPIYSLGYRTALKSVDQNVVRDLIADGEYILWMPVVMLGKI